MKFRRVPVAEIRRETQRQLHLLERRNRDVFRKSRDFSSGDSERAALLLFGEIPDLKRQSRRILFDVAAVLVGLQDKIF